MRKVALFKCISVKKSEYVSFSLHPNSCDFLCTGKRSRFFSIFERNHSVTVIINFKNSLSLSSSQTLFCSACFHLVKQQSIQYGRPSNYYEEIEMHLRRFVSVWSTIMKNCFSLCVYANAIPLGWLYYCKSSTNYVAASLVDIED